MKSSSQQSEVRSQNENSKRRILCVLHSDFCLLTSQRKASLMDSASPWAETPSAEVDRACQPASLEQALSCKPLEAESGEPSANDQSRLFDLLGKIDHKVLMGECLYIEVRGVVYKVLYGVYWRSIYSGAQYWGLRCEEIARGMWIEGSAPATRIDVPICYTTDGWMVEEQSLKFLLHREWRYERMKAEG